MIIGKDLIESQKLYSTGNDDLDELLEMAFSDGYEYAQYEFSEKEEKKDEKKKKKEKKEYKNDSHRGYGRAILIGGPLTSLGVGAAAGRYVGKREVEEALEEGVDLKEAKRRGEKKAAIVGAIGGGATRGLKAIALGGSPIYATAMGAGRNALGAYLGTKRVNEDWKRKRHDDDDDD